jgi:ankyrin repeat protein
MDLIEELNLQNLLKNNFHNVLISGSTIDEIKEILDTADKIVIKYRGLELPKGSFTKELVNIRNMNSERLPFPLHVTVEHNLLEIAKLLLSKGASISFSSINGQNALNFAISQKKYDFIELFLNNLPPGGYSLINDYYLERSLLYGHVANCYPDMLIIRLLLDHGSDWINKKTSYSKNTLIHIVVETGNIDVLKLLLEYLDKASLENNRKTEFLNYKNCNGLTALDIAKNTKNKNIKYPKGYERYEDIIKLLKANGAVEREQRGCFIS